MVVAAVALVDAVGMRRDPCEILPEPALRPLERLAFQVSHALEHPDGPCDLDEVNRVDDAGAASRRPPLDRLAVQEMRAHAFFFSSRRRHTRFDCDWSSDVCSSD